MLADQLRDHLKRMYFSSKKSSLENVIALVFEKPRVLDLRNCVYNQHQVFFHQTPGMVGKTQNFIEVWHSNASQLETSRIIHSLAMLFGEE